MNRTTTTAAVSLLLLLAPTPTATAAMGSCVDSNYTVGVGGQTVACSWTCESPSLIWVSADATDNDAGVSADADCGDGHSHCSSKGGCTSEPDRSSSGGSGTCKAVSQEAFDSGLHVECSSDPEEVKPPVDEEWCPVSLGPPPYPEVCIRPLPVACLALIGCNGPGPGWLRGPTCDGADMTRAAVLTPGAQAAGSEADKLYLCQALESIGQKPASGSSAHIIAAEGYAFGYVCTGTGCVQVFPECSVEADGGFICVIR